jgi:neutral ceramidase
MTTYEEYQLQRYEGASTLFGPWSLAASQQVYARLAQALVSGEKVEPGPTPEDLYERQSDFNISVVADSTPFGLKFGDIHQDVKPSYRLGETVEAVFWGAHPKNNFRVGNSFLEIQRLNHKKWETVRRDWDWDTAYHWKRSGLASSLITITWQIGADTKPGQYRIVHHGDSKSIWDEKISPYVGYSSTFTVR